MVWLFFFFSFTLKSVLSFGCVYELESVSHPIMMRMVEVGSGWSQVSSSLPLVLWRVEWVCSASGL
jgi:hypothetical protein